MTHRYRLQPWIALVATVVAATFLPYSVTAADSEAARGIISVALDGSLVVDHPQHPETVIRADAHMDRANPGIWRVNDSEALPDGGLRLHSALRFRRAADPTAPPATAMRTTTEITHVDGRLRYHVSITAIDEPDLVKGLSLAVSIDNRNREGLPITRLTLSDETGAQWTAPFQPDLAVRERRTPADLGLGAGARWRIEQGVGLSGSLPADGFLDLSFGKSHGRVTFRAPIILESGRSASFAIHPEADYALDLTWRPTPVELAEAIAQGAGVERLSVSEVQEVPPAIGELSDLAYLALKGATMTELPDSIGELTNLHTLKTAGDNFMGLERFPDSIGELENLRFLSSYHTALTELPESIGRLQQLETLFIAHCRLQGLPESIGDCSALREIKLPDNLGFGNLPESIGRLQKLEYLNLAGAAQTAQTRLPDSFGRLANLREFYLRAPLQEGLPSSFSDLDRLRMLGIGHTELTSIPDELDGLDQLRLLDFGRNEHVQRIDCDFTTLPSLVWLGIGDSPQLHALPASLASAPRVRSLQFSGTSIQRLPAGIEAMSALVVIGGVETDELAADIRRRLPHFVETEPGWWAVPHTHSAKLLVNSIQRTQMMKTPHGCELVDLRQRGLAGTLRLRYSHVGWTTPSLRTLDCTGNQLEGLENETCALLSGITDLRLAGNRFTDLPSGVASMRGLRRIDLRGNPLAGPPAVLAELRHLELVDLRGCGLDEEALATIRAWLPQAEIRHTGDPDLAPFEPPSTVRIWSQQFEGFEAEFAEPEALRHLELAYHNLFTMPAFVASATSLEYLSLTGNWIDELPAAIGSLQSLQTLDLSLNQLRALPSSIEQLTGLEDLDCSLNDFKEFPEVLTALRSLRRLDLAGNLIETLPDDLSGLKGLEMLDLSGNLMSDDELARIRAELPDTEVVH